MAKSDLQSQVARICRYVSLINMHPSATYERWMKYAHLCCFALIHYLDRNWSQVMKFNIKVFVLKHNIDPPGPGRTDDYYFHAWSVVPSQNNKNPRNAKTKNTLHGVWWVTNFARRVSYFF